MVIQCPQCRSRYDSSLIKSGETLYCDCGIEIQIPNLPNIAKSWNCPNCGGNVDARSNHCDYCEAYIAFERCSACFSIAPYAGAKHCAECGELLTLPLKTVKDDKSEQPCPRCNHKLESKVINNYLVDFCMECEGIWLAHHLFDELLKKLPPNSIGALGYRPPKNNDKIPTHKVRYLRCPECDVTMSRHNFMYNSDIILDQCNEHGVWFDKHELALALDFVRSSRIKPTSKKPLNRATSPERITHPGEAEIFDISYEDLESLLQEFPHFINKQP